MFYKIVIKGNEMLKYYSVKHNKAFKKPKL